MLKKDGVKILGKIQQLLKEVGCSVNDIQFKKDILKCMEEIKNTIDNCNMKGDMDMNNARRKRLAEARKLIDQANDIINEVMIEETDAFENLSEGLQQTMRGEQMEDNISEMEEAIDKIEEILDNIDNVQ